MGNVKMRNVCSTKYDGDIDMECVALCDAMNLVPGIRTRSSCCGHGKSEYRIFFEADSLASLPPLLYWFAGCHCGHYGWRITVTTDCGMCPAYFYVEGPIGKAAYKQAEEIASLIKEDNEKDESE
jgi:hypothetical protein